MKSCSVLFTLALCMLNVFHTSLDAQHSVLKEKLTIQLQNANLHEAIQEIEARSHASFSYGQEVLKSDTRISIDYVNRELSDVLELILVESDFDYKLIDDKIVLFGKKKVKAIPMQRFSMSGYIEDAATGEKLIGANIYIKENGNGSSTNVHGYYSITLEAGMYTLEISYVGYESETILLDLTENMDKNFQLSTLTQFQEIEIVANREVFKPSEKAQMSVTKLLSAKDR